MKKIPLILLASITCAILFGGLIAYLPRQPEAAQATVEEALPTFKTYVNVEKHYSIDYPSEWTREELPQLDIVLISPTEDSDPAGRGTMNIVSESVGDTVTLEQFYDESVKQLNTELKEVAIVKSGNLLINGLQSKWVEYTHNMFDTEFQVLQYFMVSKGHIYLLTFSSAKETFDEYLPKFKTIALSFNPLAEAE